MDRLWTPWRYAYVAQGGPDGGCIFCEKAADNDDAANLVVHRGSKNLVLMNLYPYTSGHVMIAPYQHVASLEEADEATLEEMMSLARLAEKHLRAIYGAPGLNIGMNIGECAGAGVAGHIHMHVLPRWVGDTNFMTTTGETRVLPEDVRTSYEKVRRAFTGETAARPSSIPAPHAANARSRGGEK
ncbi:MAG: HIT domain-containing protein [Acidobacteria bacterium]|nr:HIT domain-containing protein [Acidobacteriota bacterium]MBI3281584.1 HIT domain-containing protein [Acidobacteriota bacterium]